MADWKLRRATLADAPSLASCIDDAYASHAKHLPDLPDVSAGIDNDIRTNLVYVAESGNHVVGGLVLILEADYGVLVNVAVLPSRIGMGIGRALIELAQIECVKRGKFELHLTTHVGIPENIALYQYLGWHEVERAGSKVWMSKSL